MNASGTSHSHFQTPSEMLLTTTEVIVERQNDMIGALAKWPIERAIGQGQASIRFLAGAFDPPKIFVREHQLAVDEDPDLPCPANVDMLTSAWSNVIVVFNQIPVIDGPVCAAPYQRVKLISPPRSVRRLRCVQNLVASTGWLKKISTYIDSLLEKRLTPAVRLILRLSWPASKGARSGFSRDEREFPHHLSVVAFFNKGSGLSI